MAVSMSVRCGALIGSAGRADQLAEFTICDAVDAAPLAGSTTPTVTIGVVSS